MSESNAATDKTTRETVSAWQDVRADDSIQFDLPPAPEPPEPPPQWLQDFGEWLNEIGKPMSQFLAAYWYIIQYLLLGALALGAVVLVFYVARNVIANRRAVDAAPPEDFGWRPEAGAARALLIEADALAAKGQYAAAIRLILWRSVEDIAKAEPHAVTPSDTAREISHFTILSDHARQVFTMIAGHVERGIFAAQPLDDAAWQEARSAYDSFAIAESSYARGAP